MALGATDDLRRSSDVDQFFCFHRALLCLERLILLDSQSKRTERLKAHRLGVPPWVGMPALWKQAALFDQLTCNFLPDTCSAPG
jgi:hypothetical protein